MTSYTTERLTQILDRNALVAVFEILSTKTTKGLSGIAQILSSVWTVTASMIVIGAVAAYDTYLTLKYVSTLHLLEENPLGRWLMALNGGPVCDLQQVAAFITAKFVGTLIVLLTVHLLAHWRLTLASTIALTVATFQLWLAYHLTFALA